MRTPVLTWSRRGCRPGACRCNGTGGSPRSGCGAHSFQGPPCSRRKCRPWGCAGPIRQHRTPAMPAQECPSLERDAGRSGNQVTRTAPQHPVCGCNSSFDVFKQSKQMFFLILVPPGVSPWAGRYHLKPDSLRKRSKVILMTQKTTPTTLSLLVLANQGATWVPPHANSKTYLCGCVCVEMQVSDI